MTIKIIIANKKEGGEFIGASRIHQLVDNKPSIRIVQKGISLNPEQYKGIYKRLIEIDQLINQSP